MALAWNEIKDCALTFYNDWAKVEFEDADAHRQFVACNVHQTSPQAQDWI
ncbi:MAG: hypothetical protein Q8M12_02920 [bacterium]|nr:hypothetical protein [bacterium]